MKTAISTEDKSFEAEEKLAQERKISRSELSAVALRKYLREGEEAELSKQYDRVFSALGGQDPDAAQAVQSAARSTLERNEW